MPQLVNFIQKTQTAVFMIDNVGIN